jgi:hypothetical protein
MVLPLSKAAEFGFGGGGRGGGDIHITVNSGDVNVESAGGGEGGGMTEEQARFLGEHIDIATKKAAREVIETELRNGGMLSGGGRV